MHFHQWKRREVIALLGGATTWPLAARAQHAGKLPTIGFLGGSPSYWGRWVLAFVHRLRELGWTEGKTIAIEYRWHEGSSERMDEIATEFARLKVDLIVASGAQPVAAAMQATSVTPIVFTGVGDPVGSGLVASLSRPGGNVTGISTQAPELAGKRIELLREIVSPLGRLAILANVGSSSAALDMAEAQAAASALGLEVTTLGIRRAEEITPALATLKGAHAVYVVIDPMLSANRIRIHTLTLAARLPTMHGLREFVEAGGLMSYGLNLSDTFRRAADLTDKILRGTKPADIPVEQPTKFDLTVNLTTAMALGLAIPESFLVRADEVIE
jgi:putative tryptophan/tyrosine transport system substrate-binding protein